MTTPTTRDDQHDHDGRGAAPDGPRHTGGGLTGAVHAEWTKLWSLRSTAWTLAAAGLMMILMCLIVAASIVNDNDTRAPGHPGVVSASGVAAGAVDMVQFVVLALAILVITGEYATGSIRSTLQWVPVRHRMLLSKAAVVAAVVFPTGIALNLIGTAAAYPVLGKWGRQNAGDLTHDALLTAVYLTLISLMIIGCGAMLRSTATTLTTAFLFLMVLPATLTNTGSRFAVHVADALPSSAGRHLIAGEDTPYPAAAALAILAAWVAAGLWGGIITLRRRDA
ncbi:ABC transporter permease [Actinomadura rubrisoli]|uniref:ABC transporter permease n=1 Tax=Actinomadura rubrisoli TaxID=2530368 RepID=A0A4R4ZMW3_9ACTN|nr:ABC transporter permease [Actinomadura rubrisoli]TDD59935.1 ABC transporter permease [Actinomadura rubrisoli]